jgi:SAM-dependent methyltransferase
MTKKKAKPRKMRTGRVMTPIHANRRFGAEFFARFYGDPVTRVADEGDAQRLAGLIGALLSYHELPVRSILDAGCGVGLLRRPLERAFPRARYVGLDSSAYLCRRYGWRRGSIADYAPRISFDLVICHDVLQYLDDRLAARAVTNLARLTRGALYLSAPTRRDFRQAADPERSDADVHLRGADWYRRRLRRRFRHLGHGVHLIRRLRPITWQLEEPWR